MFVCLMFRVHCTHISHITLLYIYETLFLCLSIDDNLTVTERVLMFGGVGLAIVIFFLATVAAGGIIHHHGWQKGWTAGKDAIALGSD